ncbi:unnamed protein product [Arctogadus glacialis]
MNVLIISITNVPIKVEVPLRGWIPEVEVPLRGWIPEVEVPLRVWIPEVEVPLRVWIPSRWRCPSECGYHQGGGAPPSVDTRGGGAPPSVDTRGVATFTLYLNIKVEVPLRVWIPEVEVPLRVWIPSRWRCPSECGYHQGGGAPPSVDTIKVEVPLRVWIPEVEVPLRVWIPEVEVPLRVWIPSRWRCPSECGYHQGGGAPPSVDTRGGGAPPSVDTRGVATFTLYLNIKVEVPLRVWIPEVEVPLRVWIPSRWRCPSECGYHQGGGAPPSVDTIKVEVPLRVWIPESPEKRAK